MTLDIWFIALLFLALNLAAFLALGIDKRRARTGARRIPEKHLLWLGVPLTALGMWLGMRVFRHKTRKPVFLALAAVVTLANLVVLWAAYELWSRGWLDFRG